jgi:CDP-glucose 4,6-dehydratase
VRYLITGHTGFKGAWLTLMLTDLGHEVSGVALDPEPGSLFERARVSDLVTHDFRADIRDASAVRDALAIASPDVVIHMAAQPLVRASYQDPRGTVETNVVGTLNVLEAVRATPSVRMHLVVTTDKVYRSGDGVTPCRETDPLGGHDPYSASKAMADLLAQSWMAGLGATSTAIARAGNVIGGGDVNADRLLPDLVTSFSRVDVASVRFPEAVRPWQHVLDCLQGYLVLMDRVMSTGMGGAWNFGPSDGHHVRVADIADHAAAAWGDGAAWMVEAGEHPFETRTLTLDVTRAREELGWSARLSAYDAVEWTVRWHKAVLAGEDARVVTLQQIRDHRARVAQP